MHLKKILFARDLSMTDVAEVTPGFTGADILKRLYWQRDVGGEVVLAILETLNCFWEIASGAFSEILTRQDSGSEVPTWNM